MNEYNKKLVFIGAGGHSRVLLDTLNNSDEERIYGVVSTQEPDDYFNMYRWVANNDVSASTLLDPDKVVMINGIGSTIDCNARNNIFNLYSEKGFIFNNIVHTHAIVSTGCSIKDGVQIMAGVIVQTGVFLDENVLLNTSASIDHDCVIMKSTHVAPGVVLSGNVTIGMNCHIGVGAKVIQNVKIGNNCLVGAGVTILDDVPDGTRVSPHKSLVWPY